VRDQIVRLDNLNTAGTASRIFGAVVEGGGDANQEARDQPHQAAVGQALMKQVVPLRP
jgi:hypothetical protein